MEAMGKAVHAYEIPELIVATDDARAIGMAYNGNLDALPQPGT